jgi:hypothetical protein
MRYTPSLFLSLALTGIATVSGRTTPDDVASALEYPAYQK